MVQKYFKEYSIPANRIMIENGLAYLLPFGRRLKGVLHARLHRRTFTIFRLAMTSVKSYSPRQRLIQFSS